MVLLGEGGLAPSRLATPPARTPRERLRRKLRRRMGLGEEFGVRCQAGPEDSSRFSEK
jgi:hypothetical protein